MSWETTECLRTQTIGRGLKGFLENGVENSILTIGRCFSRSVSSDCQALESVR